MKHQTEPTYGCMATGQSPPLGLGLRLRLYAGCVCDDSAAESAVVALYK